MALTGVYEESRIEELRKALSQHAEFAQLAGRRAKTADARLAHAEVEKLLRDRLKQLEPMVKEAAA